MGDRVICSPSDLEPDLVCETAATVFPYHPFFLLIKKVPHELHA